MLTSRQSAGVTPEVNLGITQARKQAKRNSPPPGFDPVETLPEVQNRGTIGPKIGLMSSKFFIQRFY